MEIRYVTEEDSPLEISRLYERSWKYAYQGMLPQDFLDGIPAGQWAGHIHKPGLHSLVMTEQGKMIGTASFCKSRWEAYPHYGEIVSIYFLPDCMGKGYGRPLLNRCVEELRRRGFHDVLLWVLEDNRRARAFYEKNGFMDPDVVREDRIGGKAVRERLYTLS